jgi:anaerobic selenocysteine-containing dehydrogenase
MGISRREFLQIVGGAAAGYLLSQTPVSRLIPAPRGAGKVVKERGKEEYIISTCLLCPGACGIRARLVDGRLVKIEGNPLHSISRGGLCAKGLSGIHLLYSPDRIKRPLKRVGERGEGSFEPIEWDEALDIVTEKLSELRRNGNPHHLVFLDGAHPGSMTRLIERFCKAYGTPNHIRDYYKDGMELALYAMQGHRQLPAYDLEKTRYILSFGTNLIDAWWSPVWASRALGNFRQGREDIRGELVQLDTKLSLTAGKADKWIPIKPGGYGPFALGVAYVIVKEKLYNREFIENYTSGFEEWRDYLLEEIRLDEISEITGVNVDTIIRTAKEFARKTPSIAIADENATRSQGGLYTAMAIYALNALVGSIESEGGVLLTPPVPYTEFPPPSLDRLAKEGIEKERVDGDEWRFPLGGSSLTEALNSIEEGKPYPVEVLFLHYSNPVYSSPQPERVKSIIKRIPFIVSFSPFMDETTSLADLILPDHTYLERWDDVEHPTIHPYPLVSIVKPVVSPLFNTRSTGDVIIEISRKLGKSIEKAIPWRNYLEYLKESLRGVFEAKRGTNFTEDFEEAQIKLLEERGFWLPAYKTFDEFWDKITKTGGWVDPVYHYRELGRVFKTPSKKFEFKSDVLKKHVEEGLISFSRRRGENPSKLKDEYFSSIGFIINGKTSPYIPQMERGGERGKGLHLIIFRPLTLSSGSLAPFPWLYEIMGFYLYVMWDSWVEMHPETAKELGLKDGDRVKIESEFGAVSSKVKVHPGCLPGVLHIPYGFGHTNYSRFAKGIGVNPNNLIPLRSPDLLGSPRWVVEVKIRKVENA